MRDRLDRFGALLGHELVASGVVLGGSVLGLYDLPVDCRGTRDLDLLFRADTYEAWRVIEDSLRSRGFAPDTSEDAILSRFVHSSLGKDEVLDVISSRFVLVGHRAWYPAILDNPMLAEGWRVPSMVHFLACKLDTWRDPSRQWHGDPASHDFEDIWTVLRGRPDLLDELRDARSPAHRHVWAWLRGFVRRDHAEDWVKGAAETDEASQQAVVVLLERIRHTG